LRQYIKWPVLVIAIMIFAAGYGAGWFQYVKYPQILTVREARQQHEELQKMTRYGEVVEVKPNAITIKSGKDEGTYTINDYTNIQISSNYVSKAGVSSDLTKYFKKGDQVDLLAKNGVAVLIHRDFRTAEP